jgi:hypothetical protein
MKDPSLTLAQVSSHSVWNDLQKHHPDVAELLTQPIWYFDRKGETSKGQQEWIRTSVFYLETGPNPRVYSKSVTLKLYYTPPKNTS